MAEKSLFGVGTPGVASFGIGDYGTQAVSSGEQAINDFFKNPKNAMNSLFGNAYTDVSKDPYNYVASDSIYGSTPAYTEGGVPNFTIPGSPTNLFGSQAAPSYGDFMSRAQNAGLFQGKPDFDTGDYDSEMNKAIGSYTNLQNTLMGLQPMALQEVDRSAMASKAGVEDYRQRGAGQIQRAGQTAGERTESAINEARRVGAELQQGIQSRFGGTTGTGAFSSEITGRETQRNIGQQRQQFEQTMRDLTAAGQDLEREVATKIYQVDADTMNQKSQLERDLRTKLASIETDKGMLRADKAKTKLGALTDYKNLIAQIDASNASVKQNLFIDYESKWGALSKTSTDLEDSYTTSWIENGFRS